MTELQWNFSVPLDQRARQSGGGSSVVIGRGRARSPRGRAARSGCLVVVVLSLFALLVGRWVASALPDPAPVSAPVLAARASFGRWALPCVRGASHVQARLRGAAWRWRWRGGCMWRLRRGMAGGSLLARPPFRPFFLVVNDYLRGWWFALAGACSNSARCGRVVLQAGLRLNSVPALYRTHVRALHDGRPVFWC